MNYFRCTVGGSGKGNTVTVTCAEEFAGLTITLSKTGKTYTKTCPSTAPYVVTFYGVENGTYTVSCTVDGQTYSETVIVQDVSCVLNYGFKWQTWVDTASQLDSSDYASLDEVLADEKALRELFLEHACVDYMAELTSGNEDLETVINNDLCAKWINNSDYALDFLGANTVIKALMDTADKYGYGEWCLMPQVPTMTSNTAPIGVASAKSVYESGYPAWKAFDNNTSTAWASGSESGTVQQQWLRYEFPTAVKCAKAMMHINGTTAETFKIQATNDTSSWTDISSVITLNNEYYTLDVPLTASTEYKYYQILILTHRSGNDNVYNIATLQFYAWAPKGNVPVMTSNTAPYGTVFYSSEVNNAWNAFNGDDTSTPGTNNLWGANTYVNAYIGYQFTNPIKANKVKLVNALNNSSQGRTKTFKIQGSDDNSTWVDLTESLILPNDGNIHYFEFDNDSYYLYYRAFIADNYTNNANYIGLTTLQFYGRELKVSVPTMTSNTAPYGEAIASSVYNSNYPIWHAFDGVSYATDHSDSWAAQSGMSAWIGYDFKKSVVVKQVYFATGNDMARRSNIQIQGSNDTSNWSNIGNENTDTTPAYITLDLSSNADAFRYWRAYLTSQNGSAGTHNTCVLQFYGLDYSEKEFEEGATKKWLYDHGVELETIATTNATKDSDKITIQGTSTSTGVSSGISVASIDFTPYNTMRAKFGDRIGWIALAVNTGVGTTSITYNAVNTGDANLPNNLGLNISSVNETKNATIYLNANYLTDVKEWWLE